MFNRIQIEFPPDDYFALVKAIERAVQESAKSFPLRLSMKDAEVRRRVAWCVSTAITLRRVLHYSVERIKDTLPRALHIWLREGAWIPEEKRRIWAAEE